MSQFGEDPFGTDDGPFGGPGQIAILGLLVAASNELIAVFNKLPLADDPGGFNSATNIKNWTLTAIDPTVESTDDEGLVFIPKGAVVPTRTPQIVEAFQDEDDGKQIHLKLDSRMENRVQYELDALVSIIGEDCETLSGPTTHEVFGLKPGRARRTRFIQEDRYRDWDNEFFPADEKRAEATWRIEASGDIGLQDADKSLRKRILRRVITGIGAFKHLAGYGTQSRIKSLMRTGEVQALANSVQEQVSQEPDVLQAGVTAQIVGTPDGGAVVSLEIFARRSGGKDSTFLFEIPL